ncbi:unnamed protein product [Agarophyton chilense]
MPFEDRAGDEDVTVWLVASKEKGGILLRGRAKGCLKRFCDRCGSSFDEVSDGIFDVLLKADLEEVDESLYDCVQDVVSDEVEVSGHVRDALYLGMQTRALCTEDCVGSSKRSVGDTVDDSLNGNVGKGKEGTIAERAAGSVLLEMKKRLEQRGL